MPMRGSRKMNDVDVFPLEYFAEIAIPFYIRPGRFKTIFQPDFIHVTNGQQFTGGVDRSDVPRAHATSSDDGASEDFAGGSKSLSAQDRARDNAHGRQGSDGSFKEGTASEFVAFVHGLFTSKLRSSGKTKTIPFRLLLAPSLI